MLRPIYPLYSFLICILLSQHALANDFSHAQSDFEAYKLQMNNGVKQTNDEFAEYKKQLLDAFADYKTKTAQVWGNENSPLSNSKTNVSYLGDLNHRSIIDFEKGTVDVQIVIPKNSSVSVSTIREQLKQTIVTTLNQGIDKRSIINIAKQPVAVPSGKAVLRNQIADDKGKVVSTSNYSKLSSGLAAKYKKRTIKGEDGKSRTIYSAQFRLVPDHIRQRAKKYQDDVNNNAQQQKIPSALIFAIMETESMFNPTARSHTPAFGLMQLVPTTGALDAYRYLYNKNRVVSDTYLYQSSNNIRLGSAYLNRLYHSYLKGINDPQSRQWASIAAYNTGMGNVFSAFAGKYSKSRFGNRKKWKAGAFAAINQRSPEQVYQFLRNNLSQKEGRDYIKKVRDRLPKYQSI